jgi:cell division septum initiation protein DivIVA
MKSEILTLIREVEIVRDENLELQKKINYYKTLTSKTRDYKVIAERMSKTIKYICGSQSEVLSSQAKVLYKDYEEIINTKKQ